MDTLILAIPRSKTAEYLLGRLPPDVVASGGSPTVTLTSGDGHAYLDPYLDADSECDPEELRQIESIVGAPRMFAISFHGGGFIRRVVESIADADDVAVDNDHGIIMRGSAFVRLIRADPDQAFGGCPADC